MSDSTMIKKVGSKMKDKKETYTERTGLTLLILVGTGGTVFTRRANFGGGSGAGIAILILIRTNVTIFAIALQFFTVFKVVFARYTMMTHSPRNVFMLIHAWPTVFTCTNAKIGPLPRAAVFATCLANSILIFSVNTIIANCISKKSIVPSRRTINAACRSMLVVWHVFARCTIMAFIICPKTTFFPRLTSIAICDQSSSAFLLLTRTKRICRLFGYNNGL